jgi:hypothetical protein
MTATSDLENALGKFRKWHNEKLNRQDAENRPNKPLYHYTTFAGFKGIIETETLWFTDVIHLNDPTEFQYGNQIAIDLLNKELQSIETLKLPLTDSDVVKKIFIEKIIQALTTMLGQVFNVYISSFSKRDNDLSQWRAYADDARGVALGFSPTVFHPDIDVDVSMLAANDKYSFAGVVYDVRKKIAIRIQNKLLKKVLKVFEGVMSQPSTIPRQIGIQFMKDMSVEAVSAIMLNNVMLKHDAYNAEDEVRLVMHGNAKGPLSAYVKTRSRGSELVPYIPVPFPVRAKRNLKEVVIGPSAAEGAENAVRSFLYSCDLHKVVIRRSDIPYRSVAQRP